MGRIKCRLCFFFKKQAKKTIFAPKNALRVECSDPARNPYFSTDFLSAASGVVGFPATVLRLQRFGLSEGEGRALTRKKTQTISLNCGVTHSPGKI
jgi:hypothetical protein